MALQTLLLAPGMGKPIWPDLKSPNTRAAWLRIKPLLLGTAYYKTDPIVDRFLLSTASSGSLSLYYLAQQIYAAATQVINKAIAAPLVPLLSRLHKTGDRNGFRKAYNRKLFQALLISFSIVLLLGLLGERILGLLIGHGNITTENVNELWWTMIWLCGLFLGGIAGQISSSSFYALGDTSTPTRIGMYSYTLYIPVKIGSYYLLGVMGLAISASLFLVINFLIQNAILKTRINQTSKGQNI
jgi:putative peptidoglycan lipid II flippase